MSYSREDWLISEFLPTTQCPEDLSWEDVLRIRQEKVIKVKDLEVNRRYLDPPVEGQKFGLLSFIPAQGAIPNDKGFFGYVKLRGNYATEQEAIIRENEILRKVDSDNHVFTTLVGLPVPLVVQGYAKVTHQVDVKKAVEEDLKADVKAKAEKTKAQMKEVKDIEAELHREAEEGPDPLDTYTACRNKLAIHRWMIEEHLRKVKEIESLRDKCVLDLIRTLKEHPEFEDLYLQKYLETRAEKGFRDELATSDLTSMTFIKHPIIWDEEKIDLSKVADIVPQIQNRLTRVQDVAMLWNLIKEERFTLMRISHDPLDAPSEAVKGSLKVVDVLVREEMEPFLEENQIKVPCMVLFKGSEKVQEYPLDADLTRIQELVV